MTDRTATCPHCGASSSDPEFCSLCGGDMSIGSADSPWLKGGDTLEIAMSTGPGMSVTDLKAGLPCTVSREALTA
jgi:hypothetical protein